MDTIERISDLITPLLEREGLTLYDLELAGAAGSRTLRVFIDRPEGVSHEDCVTVSRTLSALLDVEDLISGKYTLEVSSPGLTRKLKKPEHFIKSEGRLAKVTFKKEYGGPSQVTGRLRGEKEPGLFIITDETGGERLFRFEDVARAKLEFEE